MSIVGEPEARFIRLFVSDAVEDIRSLRHAGAPSCRLKENYSLSFWDAMPDFDVSRLKISQVFQLALAVT